MPKGIVDYPHIKNLPYIFNPSHFTYVHHYRYTERLIKLSTACRRVMGLQFDEALERVGGFGPYQVVILLIGLLSDGLLAMVNIAYVFLAYEPKFGCGSEYAFPYVNATRLGKSNGTFSRETVPIWQVPYECDAYERNASSLGNLPNEDAEYTVQGACKSWVYDTTTIDTSLVTEVRVHHIVLSS